MNSKIQSQVKDLSFALYEPNYEVRTQHFTFVYWKNRILAIGRNNSKTNPTNLFNRKLNHLGQDYSANKMTCSELQAYLKIKNKTNIPFDKLILVNVRIGNNGKILNSRPCMSCSSLLAFCQPKSLYYSLDNGEFEKY